jgi:hypothetical protein
MALGRLCPGEVSSSLQSRHPSNRIVRVAPWRRNHNLYNTPVITIGLAGALRMASNVLTNAATV